MIVHAGLERHRFCPLGLAQAPYGCAGCTVHGRPHATDMATTDRTHYAKINSVLVMTFADRYSTALTYPRSGPRFRRSNRPATYAYTAYIWHTRIYTAFTGKPQSLSSMQTTHRIQRAPHANLDSEKITIGTSHPQSYGKRRSEPECLKPIFTLETNNAESRDVEYCPLTATSSISPPGRWSQYAASTCDGCDISAQPQPTPLPVRYAVCV